MRGRLRRGARQRRKRLEDRPRISARGKSVVASQNHDSSAKIAHIFRQPLLLQGAQVGCRYVVQNDDAGLKEGGGIGRKRRRRHRSPARNRCRFSNPPALEPRRRRNQRRKLVVFGPCVPWRQPSDDRAGTGLDRPHESVCAGQGRCRWFLCDSRKCQCSSGAGVFHFCRSLILVDVQICDGGIVG